VPQRTHGAQILSYDGIIMIRSLFSVIGSGFLELGRLGSAPAGPQRRNQRAEGAVEQHPQPPRPIG
jgi:hypothetical protein